MKACKKHRNGSCYKDLARVMNEAIMRETIAFFSKTKHYGQSASLSGEVCARASTMPPSSSSVLNAHVFEGSNCKIFHVF